MTEKRVLDRIVELGMSLYRNGYSPGTSGNLSSRLGDGYLMTPTKSSLGMLEAKRISKLDRDGAHRSGDEPSKEVVVHMAMYRKRPLVGAVVHLHSPFCTALSCLDGLDPVDSLPPITPYFVMRIGQVPLVPYFRPGDPRLAEAVEAKSSESHVILLAHHGMIVGGKDLNDAVSIAEELEQTARVYLLIRSLPFRQLSQEQIIELERVYPRDI